MGRPVDAEGNEVFQEYPKALADGYVAQNAADEAAHGAPVVAPEPEAPAAPEPDPVPDAGPDPVSPSGDPLDDVDVKMDNPAHIEPQSNELYDIDRDEKKPKKSAAHGGAKKK